MPIALVADNDPGVRTLLADLVRRGGFEVKTANDGSSARAQLESGGLQLLVCDLDMPGLSGQQLLAWLARMPHPPLVWVVSGFVDGGIERELLAYPFVGAILRKPFDVFGFVQRVRELARSLVAEVPASAPLPVPMQVEGQDGGVPAVPSSPGAAGSESAQISGAPVDPAVQATSGDSETGLASTERAESGIEGPGPPPPEAAGAGGL